MKCNTDIFLSRFVKHFSPYCHHCQDIAPAWQTLYEFYYVGTIETAGQKSRISDSIVDLEAFGIRKTVYSSVTGQLIPSILRL